MLLVLVLCSRGLCPYIVCLILCTRGLCSYIFCFGTVYQGMVPLYCFMGHYVRGDCAPILFVLVLCRRGLCPLVVLFWYYVPLDSVQLLFVLVPKLFFFRFCGPQGLCPLRVMCPVYLPYLLGGNFLWPLHEPFMPLVGPQALWALCLVLRDGVLPCFLLHTL